MMGLASCRLLLTFFLWFWKIALSNKCAYQTGMSLTPLNKTYHTVILLQDTYI